MDIRTWTALTVTIEVADRDETGSQDFRLINERGEVMYNGYCDNARSTSFPAFRRFLDRHTPRPTKPARKGKGGKP